MESSRTSQNQPFSNITNESQSKSTSQTLQKGKEAHPKKLEKDIVEDGSDSDVVNKNESEESSEEEGCEIEFPRESAADLMTYLHREINNLSNMEDPQKRKFALIKLYQIFVQAKKKAPNRIYQEILPQIQKPLFKRLGDKQEKCRELAALIIKEFFVKADDITMSIPYLIPILVERLRAEDLEGTETLPDVMKPTIT